VKGHHAVQRGGTRWEFGERGPEIVGRHAVEQPVLQVVPCRQEAFEDPVLSRHGARW
jgi:hypothetical protein